MFISELAGTDGWTEALGLGPREHVAVIGGGGKTTLCFALARGLLGAGKRVIATTTTHVWQKEAERAPCVIFWPPDSLSVNRLKECLDEKGLVFVAEALLDSGKVKGISPERADALFQDLDVDDVIVEADGAAGRPVKAPAAHEPVIPSSATLVIALMGLETLGMPVLPETIFRLDLFTGLSGLDVGDMLTPKAAAPLFQSPRGLFKGTPKRARKVVWLNKSDRLRSDEDVVDLARRLLQSTMPSIERVIVGSLLKGACRVFLRSE